MNTLSRLSPVALAAALLASMGAPAAAQVTTAPSLGSTPALTIPVVQSAVLPNGLKLQVARNAEVPIVEARLIIDGGARSEGVAPGLATFTATMLTEGAGTRDALQLSEAMDFIGARIGAGAGWENTSLSLSVPKRSVDEAFALFSDVLFRPTFKAADVKRQRDLRLAAQQRAKDSPGAVAQRVFYRNVFPANHPYHMDLGGDSANTALLDSAMVRNYWKRAADPRHATLILTGDVTLAEAKAWATKYLGSWKAPANPLTKAPARSVTNPTAVATRVILVDKPDAAQSVILIGGPGMDRDHPDYPSVVTMNTILGGSFSSRLNDLLREQLGYTYGASSGYTFSPVVGPFVARSDVRTNVTDSSLAVFFREIRKIGADPVPAVELERARNYIVLGALSSYETAGQIANALSTAHLFGRTLAATPPELARVQRVTAAEVLAAGKKHIDTDHLTVVVVGDIAKIRPGIEKLKLGPIEVQTY